MKTAKLCRNYNWLTMNWVKKTFTLHSTFILNVKRIKWNNPLTSLKCALQMKLNCVNYFCTHEIYCSSVTGPHELDHTCVMWYGGCVYGRSFYMWRLYPTRITTRSACWANRIWIGKIWIWTFFDAQKKSIIFLYPRLQVHYSVNIRRSQVIFKANCDMLPLL